MQIITLIALILTLIVTATPSHAAQPPSSNPAPEVIRLRLHPVRVAQPALRYKLLPDATELVPGNAATLYMLAHNLPDLLDPPGGIDYLNTPIDRLPRQQWEQLLANYSEALLCADLAARRQDVHWDVGLRERGFNALLPHLNTIKHLVNVLGVQARFQIAQQDWPGALRTMQTGFATARHIADRGVLIHALIQVGVAEVMLNRGVHEWIVRSDSPNLYWALSTLPQPFVDLTSIARFEQASMSFTSPLIAQAMKDKLPTDQWTAAVREIVHLYSARTAPTTQPVPAAALLASTDRIIQAALPRAREYLVAAGFPREQVEAMPPAQAAGAYFVHQYRMVSDDLWKGWELPYAESAPHMRRAQEELIRLQQQPPLNPLLTTAPHVWRARFVIARSDRYVAMLRIVEALRDHAARHEGRPPRSLDDIADLPLPMDPVTGKPFGYRSDGQTATLEAASHDGSRGRRYELTFITPQPQ